MVVIRAAETTTPVPVQLDPELRKQVEWFLHRMMQSFSKRVGETVSLICGHALTTSVVDSLPDAMLSWFLNDDPLEMDPSRVLYNKGNIDITDLTPGDSGVYTCHVQWGPEKARDNITVGVYSLVGMWDLSYEFDIRCTILRWGDYPRGSSPVLFFSLYSNLPDWRKVIQRANVPVTADNPTRYVFESDGMQLFCNSVALGLLFPTATRQWFFDNTNKTTLMPTLARNTSVEVVAHVAKSMAGVWTCLVDDVITNRNWTTAWYRLGIQDAPSFIARTYRSMADHVYVVIVVSSILLVLLCVSFIFAVRIMKKKEDETDEEFLKTRNGWEEKFSEFGTGGKVKVDESKLPPKKPDKGEGGGGEKGEVPAGEKGADFSSVEGEEGKGHKEASESRLLGEGEQESQGKDAVAGEGLDEGKQIGEGKDVDKDKIGDQVANVGDREANIGVGDVDSGEESDTNKSAFLSQQREGRNNLKVRWQSRDSRRNTGLRDNDENISNIQRHAIPGDPLAIKMSEKQERRKHVEGKRKKRKHKIIYPEVTKESALNWLLQNSPQLRKFESILRDTGNRTSTHSQGRYVEAVRPKHLGTEAHGESTSSAHASSPSNPQAQLWKMPELTPADVRMWFSRGRECVSGWTNKPASWGHSDIRYSVLPQADDDDDDFMGL